MTAPKAKLDLDAIPVQSGSRYPKPFDAPCQPRSFQRLGPAGGLTKIGLSRVRLPPGAWSSQRHWHSHEDEFLYMIEGEVVLVTDAGEELVRAGEMAAFPAGTRNGHHLQNRSDKDAVFLGISNNDKADFGEYPDIDLKFLAEDEQGKNAYAHKDGTLY